VAETRLGTHVYGAMMAETMQRLAQMDRETEVALQSQGTVRSMSLSALIQVGQCSPNRLSPSTKSAFCPELYIILGARMALQPYFGPAFRYLARSDPR
jgi:hypothetical protein